MSVHDRVANKEYPAVYSTAAQGSPPSLDEESVTRVRIDKQKDPLVNEDFNSSLFSLKLLSSQIFLLFFCVAIPISSPSLSLLYILHSI